MIGPTTGMVQVHIYIISIPSPVGQTLTGKTSLVSSPITQVTIVFAGYHIAIFYSSQQGVLLVHQPTLMRGLDQFSLLPFNAVVQKLDCRTAHIRGRTLALILLTLESHATVG